MGDLGAGARLLLVEDDASTRQALALTLRDEGHVVIEAADAGAALAALSGVDVVLLDLSLPDADGVQLCRRVRSTSDVPIIMVTGRSSSAHVVAGLQAGADDYVTKPVVGSELAARVGALLRRARPELLRPPRGR